MNGPDHYREAERLLGSLDAVMSRAQAQPNMSAQITGTALAHITAQAQVHATLAMAAATVHTLNPAPGDNVGQQWIRATS